jgi:hypothetical protein
VEADPIGGTIDHELREHRFGIHVEILTGDTDSIYIEACLDESGFEQFPVPAGGNDDDYFALPQRGRDIVPYGVGQRRVGLVELDQVAVSLDTIGATGRRRRSSRRRRDDRQLPAPAIHKTARHREDAERSGVHALHVAQVDADAQVPLAVDQVSQDRADPDRLRKAELTVDGD